MALDDHRLLLRVDPLHDVWLSSFGPPRGEGAPQPWAVEQVCGRHCTCVR